MYKLIISLIIAIVFATPTLSAEKTKKTAIFDGSCSGPKISSKSNLKGVCKQNPGKLLVKCKYKCVKKKGLKCKQRQWKQAKSMSCENRGVHRLKIVGCSTSQQQKLKSDVTLARQQISQVEIDLKAAIPSTSDRKTKKRLETSLKQVIKIKNALYGKFRVQCKKPKPCKGRPAYTLRVVGSGFKACAGYFVKREKNDRAAIMIHELAHKGTNYWGDPVYWKKSSNPPNNSYKWHTIASTYEYWARHGFCTPGIDC